MKENSLISDYCQQGKIPAEEFQKRLGSGDVAAAIIFAASKIVDASPEVVKLLRYSAPRIGP